MIGRAGAALRDAVVHEHAVRHAAEAAAELPAEPTPAQPSSPAATPASQAARRQRRLDAVAARLRTGCAAEPQPAPVKDLLRAWAQGP
jgi:hypothetical protein